MLAAAGTTGQGNYNNKSANVFTNVNENVLLVKPWDIVWWE